jgi:hypothetical protein
MKCKQWGFSCLVLCGLLLTMTVAWAQTQQPTTADAAASKRDIRVLANNIRAEVRAPLTDAELAIALRVHSGSLPCELGQVVVLTPDPMLAGHFTLLHARTTYRVSPQETTTGAIRLEDKAAGVVWLQLANKSMLMNQKLGRRLADECKSPDQARVAQAMLINPPPSVLDGSAVAPAKPVAVP